VDGGKDSGIVVLDCGTMAANDDEECKAVNSLFILPTHTHTSPPIAN